MHSTLSSQKKIFKNKETSQDSRENLYLWGGGTEYNMKYYF